uniref:Uncharacterized protein n=2 Tax=Timema TaxID=61471 RepID=A0A7R9HSZ2_9NEOP|nr:unnamed protein product [Timema cristinae]CAD7433659.1 unnamed protein product [Timema monikensis]
MFADTNTSHNYLLNCEDLVYVEATEAAWQKKLLSYQDWYHDQEAVKVNEAMRPGKALNQSELFGVEGSFRKLTVD